eukprot:7389973-Prymnesium_polylepis.1
MGAAPRDSVRCWVGMRLAMACAMPPSPLDRRGVQKLPQVRAWANVGRCCEKEKSRARFGGKCGMREGVQHCGRHADGAAQLTRLLEEGASFKGHGFAVRQIFLDDECRQIWPGGQKADLPAPVEAKAPTPRVILVDKHRRSVAFHDQMLDVVHEQLVGQHLILKEDNVLCVVERYPPHVFRL